MLQTLDICVLVHGAYESLTLHSCAIRIMISLDISPLLLPRRKPWRLCYDGVELVGVLRNELREKLRTERLMAYFKDTRGWGGEADR